MVRILRKDSEDWCHLCGDRTRPLVDVWYPENAEHDDDETEYIRICKGCVDAMQKRLLDKTPFTTCDHEHLRLTDKDAIYYCLKCGTRFDLRKAIQL